MIATVGSDAWIKAGLAEIAKGGVDRIRVEVLAKSLGVTKGGFYRRFKDRRALLDALLDTWTSGRIAAIKRQTELGNKTPRGRLKALINLYSARFNSEAMAIELAIRQWARSDAIAAKAAANVDAERLDSVAQLYRKLGLARPAAEAQAVLFYAFIFGQSLLFLEQTPRKRASLAADCANTLTEIAGT